MKKYNIKLDIILNAESEEAALKLAMPFAKVTEIHPTMEGGAGGGGWGIKYEDNTPNPIVEVSGGGTNIKREGYYTDNFNTYYIDSEGKKHLR